MIQNQIYKILGEVDSSYIKETFSSYEVEFNHPNIKILQKNITQENYTELNNSLIELNYKWDLSIDDLSYSINQSNFNNLIIEEYDETENITIRFNIYKSDDVIYILNNDAFNNFLQSLTFQNILDIINTFNVKFKIINESDDFEILVNKQTEDGISNQCYYKNLSQYPYTAETFYFNNIDHSTTSLLDDYLLKIAQAFCYISIFNTSEIKEDEIHLSISGNLSFQYVLKFNEIDVTSIKNYFEIYQWIYSEKNKIEDKLSLTRNILTSYINSTNLKIDDSAFRSILSAFEIYIKGHINKYFEVRTKINAQVEQTISDVNKSIDLFVNNFQKSTFIFISFFLSVFIFKIINKSSLENIFTKETTLLGIGFIIISFLYLIASILVVIIGKNRTKQRYLNVKKRYEDVLIKNDIEKILNNDFEYNDEIKYLTNRIIIYSIIWFLSLIVFFVTLYFTSNYI